jgi:hypothetical protein
MPASVAVVDGGGDDGGGGGSHDVCGCTDVSTWPIHVVVVGCGGGGGCTSTTAMDKSLPNGHVSGRNVLFKRAK